MIKIEDLRIRDPFIYCEKGIYYLYCARHFENEKYPCIVVLKSKDLKEFEDPIVIFTRPKDFWATKDFWAPEMHKYNGKYYLFASFKSDVDARGTQIFVSDKPDGNFIPITERAVTPNNWECLDGTLFIQNGEPYMMFCREWLEVKDGQMYVGKLSKDLTHFVEEPKMIFKASDNKIVTGFDGNYITDGPFVYQTGSHLEMIWSSLTKTGYSMLKAVSDSVYGPWKHEIEPIYADNGGHGMVYELENKKYLVFHQPNTSPLERMKIIEFKN